MSKLSNTLKALISAPHARPSYTKPSIHKIQPLLNSFAADAQAKNIGTPAWLTISTATAMTLNAPAVLSALWSLAQKQDSSLSPVAAAELQREVGLKCISFNGIPRTINCLGAFHGSLPDDVTSKMAKQAQREYTARNIEARKQGGLALWDNIYAGFERKLLDKLAESHPDLPVHIINGHYSNLLSNPPVATTVPRMTDSRAPETVVGRVLTSLVAVACLRSQTGVGPQVTSHIFGLRKAYESPKKGGAEAEGEIEVQGGKWLAGEEGNLWLLNWVDKLAGGIMEADETSQGEQRRATSFASGMEKAKL